MNAKNYLCEERHEKGIAVVVINRPEALNALNSALIGELRRKMADLDADESVRVVVLTGTGRAFVAGADISAMSEMTPEEAHAFAQEGIELMSFMDKMGKPIIAAVNGYALGGGLELAMACDLRIAGDKAKLGLPEITLGVVPGYGGMQRLIQLAGYARAKAMVYTGAMIGADEALSFGLINKVVPTEEVLASAIALAGEIAAKGAVSIRMAKRAMQSGTGMAQDQAIEYDTLAFAHCFSHEDQKEGMKAFLEKRPPRFR